LSNSLINDCQLFSSKTLFSEAGDFIIDVSMDFEEDTYTAIFSALKHPIRRKILRMLEEAPATYTEMMNALGVETGLLNYHLESLSALLAKNNEGRYRLSDFGKAALSLTRRVEEPASGRGAPADGRRAIMAFITGLLIVCVAVASYSAADTDVHLVKGYESITYDNSLYPANGLYGFEMWMDYPGALMNFWWRMNTTVDIYVMTREQYIAQKDGGGPPDQFLRRYVGSEGNVTVMTMRGINYEFAMYTGGGVWAEEHGFSVHRWKPVKRINGTLLALDALLILSAVSITALETPIVSRIEGALSRHRGSGAG